MVLAIFSPDTCTEIVTMLDVLTGRRGEGETGRELAASLGLTSEPRLSSLFRGAGAPGKALEAGPRSQWAGDPYWFCVVFLFCFFPSIQRKNIIAQIKSWGHRTLHFPIEEIQMLILHMKRHPTLVLVRGKQITTPTYFSLVFENSWFWDLGAELS